MLDQHAEDIAKSLYVLAAEKMKPLVVVVDKCGEYVSHHGNLKYYQLPEFSKGDDCIDDFSFLVGLEAEEHIELPLVTLKDNVVAKVNIITINERRYIILFDANSEFYRQQEAMQGSNETKLLNEKLHNLTTQLQLAQKELEKNNHLLNLANDSKSRFISSMSHEFRTPISAIIGFADLLTEYNNEKNNEIRYIKAIQRNSSYLLSLIDNVLEHAQLETDKLLINKRQLNLLDFIKDVESLFEAHVKETDITFRVKVDENVPQMVITDRTRLQQILINLIGNAFKYTEQGSIKVIFSWQDDYLIISIADTGVGISEKQQDIIFQPYQRGDINYVKGAGLGLSISSQLANKLGGAIKVNSNLGEGSIFTLNIEAPRLDPEEAAEFSTSESSAILIVEDDEDLVELLKIYLHEQEHRTLFARDGEEAMQIISMEKVDLLLLDMQLPKMSGLDVLTQLKKSKSKIPVIAMSASVDGDDKAQALAAGCSEYLLKPIQDTLLNHTVTKVLQKNDRDI